MRSNVSACRQVVITNLARRSLVLSLNGKDSIHLSPGARSEAISEHEVLNNRDIEKLRARALIDVAFEKSAERDFDIEAER